MSIVSGTVAWNSVVDFSDKENKAGPSMTYVERQAQVIEKLAIEYNCIACTDRFSRSNMVTAHGSHQYCADCVRSLFMRSTKDEGLFLPKCCKHIQQHELPSNRTTASDTYADACRPRLRLSIPG